MAFIKATLQSKLTVYIAPESISLITDADAGCKVTVDGKRIHVREKAMEILLAIAHYEASYYEELTQETLIESALDAALDEDDVVQ